MSYKSSMINSRFSIGKIKVLLGCKLPKTSYRTVYNLSGIWDQPLSVDLKKNIEKYWKDTVVNGHKKDGEHKSDKMYVLSMFPYPSGKLHMGHVRIYTISDAMARFYRLNGKKVIHPIGWDAFGLPAENAAIERNIAPDVWTSKNIETMKEQFSILNLSFDWEREINTSSSEYYKWTQYLFLKLFEHGLAYRKEAVVNWDPVDKTVLADEQVDNDGRSWRSGAEVEKKNLKQWFIATTKYSKSLLDGLKDADLFHWRDVVKLQKHWIGDCNGYRFYLPLKHKDMLLPQKIEIWLDKPHLIYGASFIILSTSHFMNKDIYYEQSSQMNNSEIKTNLVALHPITSKPIPIFISNSAECVPGTDSFLGIPAHDESSYEFAKKYDLPSIAVLDENETLINSDEMNGMTIDDATNEIIEFAQQHGYGGFNTSSKIRDWLVSRQRYWGTPIPIIHCSDCGEVPVPEKDLPVKLPSLGENVNVIKGSSHLSLMDDWINVSCPKCGKPSKRETDTLDTFFDSSWYYLRFLDPKNQSQLASSDNIEKYMPVDLYIGGKEHATLHLYYARFMSHFCNDIGLIKCREPFLGLLVQGMVTSKTYFEKNSGKYVKYEDIDFGNPKVPVTKGTDSQIQWNHQKMSKSRHNGVDPHAVIQEEGIDKVRLMMLGVQNPTSDKKWPVEDGKSGFRNFEKRIWGITLKFVKMKHSMKKGESKLSKEDIQKFEDQMFDARNYYLKHITHNFTRTFQLNLCITKMNGLLGCLCNVPLSMIVDGRQFVRALSTLIIILSPIMPHYCSELWSRFCSVCQNNEEFDCSKNVLQQKWPEIDPNYKLDIVTHINRKAHGIYKIEKNLLDNLSSQEILQILLKNENLKNALNDSEILNYDYQYQNDYKSMLNIDCRKSSVNS